jgi:hypothetical protein
VSEKFHRNKKLRKINRVLCSAFVCGRQKISFSMKNNFFHFEKKEAKYGEN